MFVVTYARALYQSSPLAACKAPRRPSWLGVVTAKVRDLTPSTKAPSSVLPSEVAGAAEASASGSEGSRRTDFRSFRAAETFLSYLRAAAPTVQSGAT